MTYDVYSQQSVDAYIFSSNLHGFISSFFGIFCIFTICRYSVKHMETGYKFHLLNITIWTLICDVLISIVTAPYPLLPMNGGCFIGNFPQFLTGRIPLDLISKLISFLLFLACWGYTGSVCNATIHKYLFVANLTGQGHNIPKVYIYFFMFFIQIFGPFGVAIFSLNFDLHPSKYVEESKRLYPDIFAWTINRPCIWVVEGINEFIIAYALTNLLAVALTAVCATTMIILLCSCWQKLRFAQNSTKISKRTLKMQQTLLVSLTVQCITPCFICGMAIFVFIVGFAFNVKMIQILSQNIYLILSLHSVVNFLIIIGTCPVYYKGLLRDIKMLLKCGRNRFNETPVVSITNTRRITTN